MIDSPEPDDAHEHAALHAADEWVFQKVENHKAMIVLHYMHYNFGRIHKTLRVTPAMEAGVSDHLWSLEEIVAFVE